MKLILKKETLRDLTAHKAGQVKGGASDTNACTVTCGRTLCWCTDTCHHKCQVFPTAKHCK